MPKTFLTEGRLDNTIILRRPFPVSITVNRGGKIMSDVQYPSVKNLKCPECGADEFRILGTKGSLGAALSVGMLGAVGNMAMSSASKKDFELKPVKYQCMKCKKKFEALPLVAADDELLSEPCVVEITRLSSFVGMAVSQQVYLNGVKVGNLKNGATLTFNTFTKENTVFVTDQYGVAFKGDYKFTAVPGGKEEIKFNRKFL